MKLISELIDTNKIIYHLRLTRCSSWRRLATKLDQPTRHKLFSFSSTIFMTTDMSPAQRNVSMDKTFCRNDISVRCCHQQDRQVWTAPNTNTKLLRCTIVSVHRTTECDQDVWCFNWSINFTYRHSEIVTAILCDILFITDHHDNWLVADAAGRIISERWQSVNNWWWSVWRRAVEWNERNNAKNTEQSTTTVSAAWHDCEQSTTDYESYT